MAIRTSVAALMSITVLFVGVFAVSESSQQNVNETVINNTSGAPGASSMADSVFDGLFTAGTGAVWFGVAAVVVVALGFLVVAGASGGR